MIDLYVNLSRVEDGLDGLNLGSKAWGPIFNEIKAPSWFSEDDHDIIETECEKTDVVGNDSFDEVGHPFA